MRTTAFAAAGLAVAGLAVPALAAPARTACTGAGFTDPAGDVEAAPGVAVPDDHLDLRTVELTPSAKAFRVSFADTKLDLNQKGVWRLTFTSRGTSFFVTAGLGIWANAGSAGTVSGFHAGVVNRTAQAVSGGFDYQRNTITVSVPYAVFGSAIPRGRTVVADVAVQASETFAHAGGAAGTPSEDVAFTDTAYAARLAVSRC